jgi:TrmH family RNA methyltransferase
VDKSGVQVIEVTEEPFRKMACGGRIEGLLAVAPQIRRLLHEHLAVADGLYIITESIVRPGNLGSIVRSADGAGADAVIVCDRRTDVFDPKAVRASLGTLFSVSILESSSQQALAWCRANGVRVLAATPRADTVYSDVNMREAVAILVGAECGGLSRLWMEEADVQVRLPMLGQVDSLGVVAAATLLLYEAVRQRGLGVRDRAGREAREI